jgi:hypothetical protein
MTVLIIIAVVWLTVGIRATWSLRSVMKVDKTKFDTRTASLCEHLYLPDHGLYNRKFEAYERSYIRWHNSWLYRIRMYLYVILFWPFDITAAAVRLVLTNRIGKYVDFIRHGSKMPVITLKDAEISIEKP